MYKSNIKKEFLPFALPSIGEDEIAAVIDTMRSGWLTTGPKTAEFETAFAEAVGARYALAVNSATAGLHLALEAIGVGPGDLVITTPWTFTATAEVIRYLGAHPLFVDVDPDTLNLSPTKVEQCIQSLSMEDLKRLKVILPVHFGGQACEMDALMDIAQRYRLMVVEDAAHAFPTSVKSRSTIECEVKQRSVGCIGHITVFSFYATKTIATGEGGMVTTEYENLAERIKRMRLHGISRDVWDRYTSSKPSWYYEVIAPGFKYNLSDIASAIGLQQLKRAEIFRKRREAIAHSYNQAFVSEPLLELPTQRYLSDKHAWHLYILRLNFADSEQVRAEFITAMIDRGIGCSVHYIPLHFQPYWRSRYGLTPQMYPVASKEYARVVSLPIYPTMTDMDVDRVVDTVFEVLQDFY